MLNLDQFISQYVTKRPESMFYPDIEGNWDALSRKIIGKSVLVIEIGRASCRERV